MSFQNHFNMLSLNEPVTHKAKFWQSYVRALKGTDDMRADESRYIRPRGRALSEFPDYFGKSLLGDYSPFGANDRIHAPGYRYLPISRETYGYSPRHIYGLSDRPRYVPRPSSVPPDSPYWRPTSYTPVRYPPSYYSPRPWDREGREGSLPLSLSSRLSPRPWDREGSLPPSFPRSWDREGSLPPTLPSYNSIPLDSDRGNYNRQPYLDMLNPSSTLPMSRVSRDPWWYDAYGLKPYRYIPRSVLTYPSALRNSYLSPIRNHYLWSRHPMRYL